LLSLAFLYIAQLLIASPTELSKISPTLNIAVCGYITTISLRKLSFTTNIAVGDKSQHANCWLKDYVFVFEQNSAGAAAAYLDNNGVVLKNTTMLGYICLDLLDARAICL